MFYSYKNSDQLYPKINCVNDSIEKNSEETLRAVWSQEIKHLKISIYTHSFDLETMPRWSIWDLQSEKYITFL